MKARPPGAPPDLPWGAFTGSANGFPFRTGLEQAAPGQLALQARGVGEQHGVEPQGRRGGEVLLAVVDEERAPGLRLGDPQGALEDQTPGLANAEPAGGE